MHLLLPDNIFSRILSSAIEDKEVVHLHHFPSGLLCKKLNEENDYIGLIPTLDLLHYNELFVSPKFGISFDESISNSYIYFDEKQKIINEIVLAGDVSVNEGILTKILFSETYGIDVELLFEKTNGGSADKNRILAGDRNFIEGNLDSAISFTEEIIEMISAPYVNFVFASKSESALIHFQSMYKDKISQINSTKAFQKFNKEFSPGSENYFQENLHHVMFNFDEQDLEGIKQLLQLPYLRGIIKDMIDVRFV